MCTEANPQNFKGKQHKEDAQTSQSIIKQKWTKRRTLLTALRDTKIITIIIRTLI
ncbi:hypothetical protein PDIG_59640 [Penicillium digitatum PHI26]|uniref:Uncharacterized protein n=1 Tax=Penicillium digitatum (strain PHI26 / CECT 20796) TaxID=1170229 RepID=K9FKZ5_PEND2|nr:hypothetical protein PDIG_59640 [Penicillium digitatum PHI26]